MKIQHVKYIMAVFAFSLLLLSCSGADDIIKSYGKDITQSRQIGTFNNLLVGEKFDVELRQDSTKEGTIEITAGKNVIDGYATKVSNGELIIENTNKYNWVRNLKVRQKVVIYFKKLDKIQINGSAKLWNVDTIRQQRFSVHHDGLEDAEFTLLVNNLDFTGTNTGGAIFKGRSYIFSGSVDDISFVNNKALTTHDTYLTSFSKANSHINAEKKLNVTVYGTGNVYYSLEPTDIKILQEKGEGRIIKE